MFKNFDDQTLAIAFPGDIIHSFDQVFRRTEVCATPQSCAEPELHSDRRGFLDPKNDECGRHCKDSPNHEGALRSEMHSVG